MNLEIMLIFRFIRAVTHLSVLKVSGFFSSKTPDFETAALLFTSFKLFFDASCRNQEMRAEEKSVYILKLYQEPTMRIEVS